MSQWQVLAVINGARKRRGYLIIKVGMAYHVDRLMYCFHASLPDSRPPPVAFSPPKAPPISAPLVGILTLTIPVSAPVGLIENNNNIKDSSF